MKLRRRTPNLLLLCPLLLSTLDPTHSLRQTPHPLPHCRTCGPPHTLNHPIHLPIDLPQAFTRTGQKLQQLMNSALSLVPSTRGSFPSTFPLPPAHTPRRVLQEDKGAPQEGGGGEGDVSRVGRVDEMERELKEVAHSPSETQNSNTDTDTHSDTNTPSNSDRAQVDSPPSPLSPPHSQESTPQQTPPSELTSPQVPADVTNCTEGERGCCNEDTQSLLHSHLHKIVVILNFNFPWTAHQLVPFWRKIYGRVFDHVVFVSSSDIPELGVMARGPLYVRDDWRMQYWCLPKIMAQFPEAEGFLWTNDDVIVNYWKFLRADKTKFWLPNDPNNLETRHFPFDENAPAMSEEENSDPKSRRKAKMAYDLLDQSFKEIFDNSSRPHVGHYQKRICDLFYVPRRHVEALAFDVIPAFREARVNSESAIPSMFYAIDHPDNFDRVLDDMVYRWEHWSPDPDLARSYDPLKFWSKDISELHPWKASDPEMQRKLVQSLRQGDPCVCREFPDVCAQDAVK